MRKYLPIFLSALLAVLFTVYISLDTFVIARVSVVVEQGPGALPLQPDAAGAVSAAPSAMPEHSAASEPETVPGDGSIMPPFTETTVFTENSYTDQNIAISLDTYHDGDTTIHVADIHISSPEYLKTAFAQSAYGKNVTAPTSEIATSVQAILAINGDYYGVQESGYVLRNGVIYRSTGKNGQEDLVIYQDGSMDVICEDDISAETLLEQGASQVLCFGPGLIENGEIAVTSTDEVDKAMTSNPRTAIGIMGPLHYVFVVADGRTSESAGLSLYQLAAFMQRLGTEIAYNLDGGGSSTMVFGGTVINSPTTTSSRKGHSSDGERSVSDIVYIGY